MKSIRRGAWRPPGSRGSSWCARPCCLAWRCRCMRASFCVSRPPRARSADCTPLYYCAAPMRFGSSNGRRPASSSLMSARNRVVFPRGSRAVRSDWAPGCWYCASRSRIAYVRCSSTAEIRTRPHSDVCAGASQRIRGRVPIPSRPRFEVRHAALKIIQLERPQPETFGDVQGLFSSQGAGVLL